MENRPISTMPCQCKACLDQLASPQWLWFHEQQHHANHKILACPHCDTILPTKAKYFPADNRKLLGQLLRCPSCNRQDQLHLFLRRQTAFACGFCSASFHSSSSSSSSPHSSSATKTTSSSGPSDSHKRAKRRFFTHLATELARNDELIEQGQPPREWSRTNVIYGLLQRPGIVKHWKALVVGSKDKEEGKDGGGGADMCKIPAGVDAFFSWDNVDALVHTDMNTDTARVSGSATKARATKCLLFGNWNLQGQLEYFDPEKDGDEKAAKLAELAFEQADKLFQHRARRVETKFTRRNDPGSVGNQSDEKGGGEKKVDMDKPLPELPTVATFSPSSTVQPTGLRSTDCRRNRDRRRREDEDNKTRRRVRNVVKQIEMALSAAYR